MENDTTAMRISSGMESTRITIVGAGPAGLVLGLALAQFGIKSLILEKQTEIEQDPRGVYLAADAVRILYSLGLAKYMPAIGHELHEVQFHQSSFANPPFHVINLIHDHLQQAVPNGILQIQPELEQSLRAEVNKSHLCELRLGCDVQAIEKTTDGVALSYSNLDGTYKKLQTAWLIGADGKKGVVRKKFLEKAANIRQVDAAYRYEGTWVAANLKISLPTPETHPDFPLWGLGLKPIEVYDLYWPKGWHFCSPPGKPTAAGRFGPHETRLWRHEFREDPWDPTMDAEALFWEQITPMITKSAEFGSRLSGQKVTYPRDCIQILRCRPFSFSHKVVNRWFSGRTILIGDAAHVFPPFGGQGIASGIRDAQQLAWRLALLEKHPDVTNASSENLLKTWTQERIQSVRDAAALTRINGILCNQNLGWIFWVAQLLEWTMKTLWKEDFAYDPQVDAEKLGYRRVSGGFFLPARSGGLRVPQIYLDTLSARQVLSDRLLAEGGSILKLLMFVEGQSDSANKVSEVMAEVRAAKIPACLLTSSSISVVSLQPGRPDTLGHFSEKHPNKSTPIPKARLSSELARQGYSASAMKDRLGSGTRYALVRPDFYVFALARDLAELRVCLHGLQDICKRP